MLPTRSSGILMHPTSLPAPFGVGDLGRSARDFADRLAEADQSWWQILPLHPPGYGGSPYSALSAFAGNPTLIDPEPLVERGWLGDDDLDDLRAVADDETFRIAEVTGARLGALRRAYRRWSADDDGTREDFEAFRADQSDWLEDYTLFMALKEAHDGRDWRRWDDALVRRESAALDDARRRLAPAVERHAFQQWLFWGQWRDLRDYAAERGVRFIGDIPIFVAMDSADVWAERQIFELDADGQAARVAGVPPDYFSATGQKWGNPLYDWSALEDSGYDWWLRRIDRARRSADLMRIDHFRGFESYWAVPADAPNAITGEWEEGPGDDFFAAVRDEFGEIPFIAEDLGMITEAVEQLRDRWKLPGMKVLQFAFGADEPDHPFLPHTYPQRCVAYTGTHDNDTTRGWYDALDEATRHRVRSYLSCPDDAVVWSMIEAIWESEAALTIAPLQDLYELGGEARMNEPSTTSGNWTWRATDELLADRTPFERLAALTHEHERALEA